MTNNWLMGMVINDVHIPFQDNKALDLVLYFAKCYSNRLDYLFINGDLIDCWEISKYDKVPKSAREFSDEVEETKDILKLIRKLLPNTKIIYIEGNHEFRFKHYLITHAPAFYGLEGMNIGSFLGCKDLGIEYITSREGLSKFSHNDFKLGELYIGHYDRVSKNAAYTSKALIDDLGVSHIQGHVHRFGVTSKSFRDGRQLIGVENGCLCDLNPNYVSFPNWQHGFSVFYMNENDGKFQVYPIRIFDYSFYFGEKFFDYAGAIQDVYGVHAQGGAK